MDKRHVINLLIILVLLLPASIMAQVLTGTVSSEGKTLVGANVVVKGTTIGTSTDATGAYTLKVSPGTYDIIFSLVGYETKTLTVTLQEKEEKVFAVELKPEAVKIQEVLV